MERERCSKTRKYHQPSLRLARQHNTCGGVRISRERAGSGCPGAGAGGGAPAEYPDDHGRRYRLVQRECSQPWQHGLQDAEHRSYCPGRGDVTDWYGEQSCTTGRSAFITGQSPIRTGLTKLGLRGKRDPPLFALNVRHEGRLTSYPKETYFTALWARISGIALHGRGKQYCQAA